MDFGRNTDIGFRRFSFVALLTLAFPLQIAAAVDMVPTIDSAPKAGQSEARQVTGIAVQDPIPLIAPANGAIVALILADDDPEMGPQPLSATSGHMLSAAGVAAVGTPWRLAGEDARFAERTSPRPRFAKIVAATLAEPMFAEAMALGVGLLLAAMFVRNRHRRRIGWGVLPDRSLPRRNRG